MSYIYYCPKCTNVFSEDRDNEKHRCINCHVTTVPTHIISSEWTKKDPEEKKALREDFSKLELPEELDENNNSNLIGKALNVVGWIYIILSFLGMFALIDSLGFSIALALGISGCLGGLLLLGFGEIINLLQDIKYK